MTNLRQLVVFGGLTLFFAFPGEAQPPRVGMGQRAREFLETAPRIGESLPDLSCYDEKGNEIGLHKLTGNYTVLVFGCLT